MEGGKNAAWKKRWLIDAAGCSPEMSARQAERQNRFQRPGTGAVPLSSMATKPAGRRLHLRCAAVYRLNDQIAIVQTVDYFTPVR